MDEKYRDALIRACCCDKNAPIKDVIKDIFPEYIDYNYEENEIKNKLLDFIKLQMKLVTDENNISIYSAYIKWIKSHDNSCNAKIDYDELGKTIYDTIELLSLFMNDKDTYKIVENQYAKLIKVYNDIFYTSNKNKPLEIKEVSYPGQPTMISIVSDCNDNGERYIGFNDHYKFSVGDKVIIHCKHDRNDTLKNFYNGNIGTITDIWDIKYNIVVKMEDGKSNCFSEDELKLYVEH